MNKEDLRGAVADQERKAAYFLWITQRKEALLSSITAHEVLRQFGIDLKHGGSDTEEQICCPFHGDSSPSARVYPAQGSNSSGVWCYVCRKRWDIFSLWKEFNNEPEMKFHVVISGLERRFGISPPEAPDVSWSSKPKGPTEEEQDVLRLLQVCENRLAGARDYFPMKSFITLGHLLDILHFEVHQCLIDLSVATQRLNLILSKIREKIAAADG